MPKYRFKVVYDVEFEAEDEDDAQAAGWELFQEAYGNGDIDSSNVEVEFVPGPYDPTLIVPSGKND